MNKNPRPAIVSKERLPLQPQVLVASLEKPVHHEARPAKPASVRRK